jgi:hypothetical protein
MDAETKRLVRERAEGRCEYCRVRQQDFTISFHVEHIVAHQHHGDDDESNLALACHRCNRFKGPNLSGVDPDSGHVTRLFHPRNDSWDEHFRIERGLIIGITPVGRTTVALLQMNSPERLGVRRRLAEAEGLD